MQTKHVSCLGGAHPHTRSTPTWPHARCLCLDPRATSRHRRLPPWRMRPFPIPWGSKNERKSTTCLHPPGIIFRRSSQTGKIKRGNSLSSLHNRTQDGRTGCARRVNSPRWTLRGRRTGDSPPPHRGFAAAAPGTLSPQSPVHSRPCPWVARLWRWRRGGHVHPCVTCMSCSPRVPVSLSDTPVLGRGYGSAAVPRAWKGHKPKS